MDESVPYDGMYVLHASPRNALQVTCRSTAANPYLPQLARRVGVSRVKHGPIGGHLDQAAPEREYGALARWPLG
jgi:hypothetical protein